MFFVNKVILVEGTTDKALLNYLIQERELYVNVYVVDCGLKTNIPNFMNLCRRFGIQHSIMFDRDEDKGTHKSWNQKIVDARSEFTINSLEFPKDLESYIGFKTPIENYKKPLEMLKQAKDGKLKKEFEEEFIKFIKE